MNQTYEIIRGTLILIVAIAAAGWVFWWRLKRSRDPGGMIFRWVLTAAIVFAFVRYCGPMLTSGGPLAVVGLLVALVCCIPLMLVWVPAITDAVGRKFGSLYDGGDAEVEARPFYSIAQAQRGKGNYQRALAEVRKQLEKFPNDLEGQMLLASLQAENLDDLPGAELTIQRFLAQPGHAPANISYVLNQLADWHLKIDKDREAARRALEQIITLLPDSEMSLQAAQRIGRLADIETLLESKDRQPVAVHKGVDNLGLAGGSSSLRPAEANADELAAAYVKHLEEHPLDGHIRELLAVLYASQYQRLDLAADQLEQLIETPNQPARQVVHWLNLLADLQIQNGAPLEEVRGTLQRIVDQHPELAAAETARRRIDTLKLELNARKAPRPVRLGTYEQNIGLKGRGAPRPS